MQLSLLQTHREVLSLSPTVVELARRVIPHYDLTNLAEYFLARMASFLTTECSRLPRTREPCRRDVGQGTAALWHPHRMVFRRG
jgi:hypothetical protein